MARYNRIFILSETECEYLIVPNATQAAIRARGMVPGPDRDRPMGHEFCMVILGDCAL